MQKFSSFYIYISLTNEEKNEFYILLFQGSQRTDPRANAQVKPNSQEFLSPAGYCN